MQVYCPKCKEFLRDAKMFRFEKPMPCPNCKIELEFTTDTEKKAPLAVGIIVMMMILHNFGIVSKEFYGVFLIIGIVMVLGILFMSNVIAKEVEK